MNDLPIYLEDMNVFITKNAITHLKLALKEENKEYIRIGVKGGGCSGFQFLLEAIDSNKIDDDEDIVEMYDGVMLVMDIFSKEYLKGTTIDYISSLKESGFKFDNPNSKKTCGCGSSFSV